MSESSADELCSVERSRECQRSLVMLFNRDWQRKCMSLALFRPNQLDLIAAALLPPQACIA